MEAVRGDSKLQRVPQLESKTMLNWLSQMLLKDDEPAVGQSHRQTALIDSERRSTSELVRNASWLAVRLAGTIQNDTKLAVRWPRYQ